MLTNNPATFAPIEINKIKPRLFGLIKVTPQDGIRVNHEIGEFIKKLKAWLVLQKYRQNANLMLQLR